MGYEKEPPLDKTLSSYELHRKPRPLVTDPNVLVQNLHTVREQLNCVVCQETMRDVKVVLECLHRFCKDCAEKSLRCVSPMCPICRAPFPSRRHMRSDSNLETLLAALFPDLDAVIESEQKAVLKYNQDRAALYRRDAEQRQRKMQRQNAKYAAERRAALLVAAREAKAAQFVEQAELKFATSTSDTKLQQQQEPSLLEQHGQSVDLPSTPLHEQARQQQQQQQSMPSDHRRQPSMTENTQCRRQVHQLKQQPQQQYVHKRQQLSLSEHHVHLTDLARIQAQAQATQQQQQQQHAQSLSPQSHAESVDLASRQLYEQALELHQQQQRQQQPQQGSVEIQKCDEPARKRQKTEHTVAPHATVSSVAAAVVAAELSDAASSSRTSDEAADDSAGEAAADSDTAGKQSEPIAVAAPVSAERSKPQQDAQQQQPAAVAKLRFSLKKHPQELVLPSLVKETLQTPPTCSVGIMRRWTALKLQVIKPEQLEILVYPQGADPVASAADGVSLEAATTIAEIKAQHRAGVSEQTTVLYYRRIAGVSQ